MADITGSAGGNKLIGTDEMDTIKGLAGDDKLYGQGGTDFLHGGAGNDLMNGGFGSDFAVYTTDAIAGVTVDLAAGTATGGAGNDILKNIENIDGGMFADSLSGNDGNNFINGNGGNDVLFGAGGDDTLLGSSDDDIVGGGLGNNMLNGGEGADSVSYTTIVTAVTVDLDAGSASGTGFADSLTEFENVLGSKRNDAIGGDAGANRLSGRGGDDAIDGRGGNDTLVGGKGADTMTGGAGADQFVYTELTDSVPGAFDLILDFARAEGDKIRLAPLDAKSGVVGNQAFTFIDDDTFSAAGQLRYQKLADGTTRVEASTDGDPAAELVLVIDAAIDLLATDFVL